MGRNLESRNCSINIDGSRKESVSIQLLYRYRKSQEVQYSDYIGLLYQYKMPSTSL
jgi:hypothetical protein